MLQEKPFSFGFLPAIGKFIENSCLSSQLGIASSPNPVPDRKAKFEARLNRNQRHHFVLEPSQIFPGMAGARKDQYFLVVGTRLRFWAQFRPLIHARPAIE